MRRQHCQGVVPGSLGGGDDTALPSRKNMIGAVGFVEPNKKRQGDRPTKLPAVTSLRKSNTCPQRGDAQLLPKHRENPPWYSLCGLTGHRMIERILVRNHRLKLKTGGGSLTPDEIDVKFYPCDTEKIEMKGRCFTSEDG